MTSPQSADVQAPGSEADAATVELVETALRKVYDPCSVAAGTAINIVDMGLVRNWKITGHRLDIDFCVTAVSCRLAPSFVRAAEGELLKIPGIDEIKSRIDPTFTWTEDQLAAPARARLEEARAAARGSVRPQQWRSTGPRQSGRPGSRT